MTSLRVIINGTEENPWHLYGLQQNPFPQLGKHEYVAAEMMLNSLDGDPVRSAEDIRRRLKGFTPEFVDLCVRLFKPGERVSFMVTFPEIQ